MLQVGVGKVGVAGSGPIESRSGEGRSWDLQRLRVGDLRGLGLLLLNPFVEHAGPPMPDGLLWHLLDIRADTEGILVGACVWSFVHSSRSLRVLFISVAMVPRKE